MVERYARYGLSYQFMWAHPTFDPSITDLELRIYDDSDTLLTTITASPEATPLGLYKIDETWLAAANGRYTMQWWSTTAAVNSLETLLVAYHPTGNEQVTVPTTLLSPPLATALGDVELRVYELDEDGELALWGSSPYATTESAFSGIYRTDDELTFSVEGYYVLWWQSAGTASEKAIEVLYIGAERGLQDVSVFVVDHTTDPNEFIDTVEVLASLADDESPVAQRLTGVDGKASFSLPEGVPHVFSLRKAGHVFSRNNFLYTPIDPQTEEVEGAANTLFCFTDYTQPTFDPMESLDLSVLSLMEVDVVDMAGRPIKDAIILVSSRSIPDVVTANSTDYAVLGSPIELTTDYNGHAEIYLVRGHEVEVAYEGTPVRRIFEVPDSASFSLISRMISADDPFDISEPNIPTAIRRS